MFFGNQKLWYEKGGIYNVVGSTHSQLYLQSDRLIVFRDNSKPNSFPLGKKKINIFGMKKEGFTMSLAERILRWIYGM